MGGKLRSSRVTLSVGFSLLVASVASACSDPAEPDHAQICVDEETLERIADEHCPDEDGGTYIAVVNGVTHRTHRAYVARQHGYPAVGEKVVTGAYSYARPSGGTISTVRPAGLGGSSYSGGGSAGS